MRALAVVLVAAFAIHLSGAGPAPAQESSTPGIWINPELGLATPEDAAKRFKAPFHTWLVDHLVDYWKELDERDWRRRIFFRMIRFGDDDHGPRLSLKAASCAVMRTADANRFGFGGTLKEPRSLLNWEWAFELLDHCVAYRLLARLKPLAPGVETGPGFLARRWTAPRLPPLVLTFFRHKICRAIDAERAGVPGLHNRLRLWDPNFHRKVIVEGTPWTKAHGETWTIWPERATVETLLGFRFQSRFYLETDDQRFIIEVWGIGALTGDPRPHLVVLVIKDPKGPLTDHASPNLFPALLVYDSAQDLFRVANLEDFEPRNRRDPEECQYSIDFHTDD